LSHSFTIVVSLLVVITALAAMSNFIKIPYPILLVLVGAFIGFVPFLPDYTLEPEIVFLIFLPPILYSAAWYTSWRDFKNDIRPISLLAIGLTLLTTTVIGFTAFYFIDGISLPIAFVIGAIISPPDAVAATTITSGLNLPKRIITILEGESLINDAIGLVAYKFAVAAVVTGSFSIVSASASFIFVSIGGIFVGLVFGYIVIVIHTFLQDNPPVETTVTILTPYVVYLTAEYFHLSGVLAVVATGLYVAWRASELFSSRTRLQVVSTWDIFIFLLNGFIFLVIGLQLPSIVKAMPNISYTLIFYYGAILSLMTILIRFAWVFFMSYFSYYIKKKFNSSTAKPSVKNLIIISWTGLRGVVSLAAAMALPLTISNGNYFPDRGLIVFLTCFVIFATLVLQGLALPYLIKFLSFKTDGLHEEELLHARLMSSGVALKYLDEISLHQPASKDMISWLKEKYKNKIKEIKSHYHAEDKNLSSNEYRPDQLLKIQKGVISAERGLIIQMRYDGDIGDETLRILERELDLEEAKLKK
jgi:monovalent cation/hydrogen antiporter